MGGEVRGGCLVVFPQEIMMSVDVLGLNPGIKRVVCWFNSMGLSTIDSGDGETHDFECDRDYAYVVIKVHPSDLVETSDWLRRTLEESGISVYAQGEDGEVCIQGNYDPVNRLAFIDVMHFTDDMLPEGIEV